MIIGNNYGHGGDIYKNKIEYDFSANVNPYGTPEKVKEAIRKSAEGVAVYPDPYCGKLRKKLSECKGIEEEYIICGNGAADLIFQFVTALNPKKTLLPVPSFSEYENALKGCGHEAELYFLQRDNDFALTESFLEAITDDTDLVMLCNPNNPTGQSIEPKLLEKLLERCREKDVWLFMDECFLDLTLGKNSVSMAPMLRKDDKVFILYAFTKLYGMAGVRLGYGICKNEDMLKAMSSLSQPWNVSTPAQEAGCAALDCGDWVKETKERIFKEKDYLANVLREMGISIIEGDANYIMICGLPGLYEKMLKKGFLIRSCANYHGLGEGDFRIAVRRHEENEAFLKALKEVLV